MSKLQNQLSKMLFQSGLMNVRENYRPVWMEGLELDFYLEDFKLAIEVQGEQHSTFIPFFHQEMKGFEAQLARDLLKRELCEKLQIQLFYIYDSIDAEKIVHYIESSDKLGLALCKELDSLTFHYAENMVKDDLLNLYEHLGNLRKYELRLIKRKSTPNSRKQTLKKVIQSLSTTVEELTTKVNTAIPQHIAYFRTNAIPLIQKPLRDKLMDETMWNGKCLLDAFCGKASFYQEN